MSETGESRVEFLTVKETAALLRMHENTVYKLLQDRKLPAARIGDKWLIRRADIDALLAKGLNV